MSQRLQIQQGTLSLMILATLDALGPMHGYGIARRIEETSAKRLALNYGTVHPALLNLQKKGLILGAWGSSENNRRAKFYRLTATGRRQLERETIEWRTTAQLMEAFVALHLKSEGGTYKARRVRT